MIFFALNLISVFGQHFCKIENSLQPCQTQSGRRARGPLRPNKNYKVLRRQTRTARFVIWFLSNIQLSKQSDDWIWSYLADRSKSKNVLQNIDKNFTSTLSLCANAILYVLWPLLYSVCDHCILRANHNIYIYHSLQTVESYKYLNLFLCITSYWYCITCPKDA